MIGLRPLRSRRLHVQLCGANRSALHIASISGVDTLILWQHHWQAQTGSSILKKLHLITAPVPDAVSIFVPSNLLKILKIDD